MRFFEVDSAVDAIMSAAMLAQTKAGFRNQQGKLSMNGFLQMLKNAGIMMDYEGFKTVYDTNPQLANVIAKFDKDSITFLSADGDDEAVDNTKPSNQTPPDERIAQMARKAVKTREFVESIVTEGAIDTLRAIVDNKQNMPVNFTDGQMKVDLFTASAITKVYDAVNDANKEKLERMMQTKAGMMRVADFAMDQVKMEDAPSPENPSGSPFGKYSVLNKVIKGVDKITGHKRFPDKKDKNKNVKEAETTVKGKPYSAAKAKAQLREISEMRRMLENEIIKLADLDNGDLTDQLTTMFNANTSMSGALRRAYNIIPEGIEEAAIPTSEFDYDLKKFYAKIKELEDQNQHGEVAEMLVTLYGNDSEAMIIRGINGLHSMQGSIMPEQQKLRDMISNKYYKKLEAEVEGKFPANTSATQGKRMGSNATEGFASDAQRKAAFASGYKPNKKKMKERSLTKGEEKEKERIVKGMKKAKGDFKDRYGDEAKAVMYATATKLAKEDRAPVPMPPFEKDLKKFIYKKRDNYVPPVEMPDGRKYIGKGPFKDKGYIPPARMPIYPLGEGMEDKIEKDIDAGMSTDAIIGKYANKRTTNTDEIRKIIQRIKFKKFKGRN